MLTPETNWTWYNFDEPLVWKGCFYNHQLVDYSWIAGSINVVVAVAITLQAESIQVSSDYNCRTGMVRGMDGRKNHGWHFNRIFGDRLVRLMKMKAVFGRWCSQEFLKLFDKDGKINLFISHSKIFPCNTFWGVTGLLKKCFGGRKNTSQGTWKTRATWYIFSWFLIENITRLLFLPWFLGQFG